MKNVLRLVRCGGFIFLCLACTTVKSQFVDKVTEINYSGYNGLNPSEITVFNGKLYFFGTDDQQYVDKLMVTPTASNDRRGRYCCVRHFSNRFVGREYNSLFWLTRQ